MLQLIQFLYINTFVENALRQESKLCVMVSQYTYGYEHSNNVCAMQCAGLCHCY